VGPDQKEEEDAPGMDEQVEARGEQVELTEPIG
jgi:hypothetical protein